jgi:hypothetical protein
MYEFEHILIMDLVCKIPQQYIDLYCLFMYNFLQGLVA